MTRLFLHGSWTANMLSSKINVQYVSVHGQKWTTYSWWLKLAGTLYTLC